MDTYIVDNLPKCERLWKKFSPNKTIWEVWEPIYSLFLEGSHKPYFIVLKEGRKEIGVLPLWYEVRTGDYTYFGEFMPEDIRFWFDEEYFGRVFEKIPKKTFIFDLNEESVKKAIEKNPELEKYFKFSDYHYFIDLEKVNYNLDDYFKTFNKKHRKNLLYDLKKLKETLNYELVWDKSSHFEEFVKFNVDRFKEESDFFDEVFVKQFKSFLEALDKMDVSRSVSIVVDGKTEGVEFGGFYNGIYYVFNGGYDTKIKNLGKLLILEHIKKAMSLKAKRIDFLSGNSGWKELWNCEKENYYGFKKE